MALHNMLQSPERDVLLVSALIATLVSLAFTGWGVAGLRGDWPGLRRAVAGLSDRQRQAPPGNPPLTGGAREAPLLGSGLDDDEVAPP